MQLTRRHILSAAVASPALVGFRGTAQAATALRISHQFPGGTDQDGDFRDRLCRLFASELAKRSNQGLTATVYPGSSLMKTNAQFSALRKGALDMSLYPLAYAGGEVPEVNIGLMPCIVSTYQQGAAWKKAPIGQKLQALMAEKGVVIVSWIWQAGGVAARAKPLTVPDDAKGAKVRGGSREMDLMFHAAGAAVLTVPSNESYIAMQTGAADAIVTSSTSLISFRLEELSKHLTTGRKKAFWFMFEPLLMSKKVFDALPKDQQTIIMEVGEQMEAFGTKEAQADDQRVAEVYSKAGAQLHDIDDAAFEKWLTLARETSWKDYAAKNASTAEFLKLAEAVIA